MWTPAARQYEALSAAAARDGVTIGITDSYRTYESQVDLAERKGLYKNGGLAAVPGTSDHGWGRSLDLKLDNNALTWMREHGAQYGFRRTCRASRGTGRTTRRGRRRTSRSSPRVRPHA